MKTKIEWRHGNRTLKLNDTSYGDYPEDGDVVQIDGQWFHVRGTESAVVVIELTPNPSESPEPPITIQKPAAPAARSLATTQSAAKPTVMEKAKSIFKVETKKKK